MTNLNRSDITCFTFPAGKMVRDVKERLCIVASDSGSINGSSCAKLYMMPDGKQAETIVYEWAKPAEILFNPALAGRCLLV